MAIEFPARTPTNPSLALVIILHSATAWPALLHIYLAQHCLPAHPLCHHHTAHNRVTPSYAAVGAPFTFRVGTHRCGLVTPTEKRQLIRDGSAPVGRSASNVGKDSLKIAFGYLSFPAPTSPLGGCRDPDGRPFSPITVLLLVDLESSSIDHLVAAKMPISSWHNAGEFAKRHIPDVFVKRKFNFITIHYMYMIGMVILNSVIIFGIGNIRYIDALYFASGACTQSGLNTVDVDLIATGQQFMLYITAMLCNPIVIHTAVVFVRLYWFEKRFKDIVRDARALRRSKSKGRTTLPREDVEVARPQGTVRGKVIRILRHTGKFLESDQLDEKPSPDANGNSLSSSDNSKRNSNEDWKAAESQRPQENTTSDSPDADERSPQHLSPDDHIRFLENQRNPKDSGVLRIPSPREFDRGGRPEYIDATSDDDMTRRAGADSTAHLKRRQSDLSGRGDRGQTNRHITIDEPEIIRPHDRVTTFPRANQRAGNSNQGFEVTRPLSNTRSQPRSSNTLRRSNSTHTVEGVPYLTYQPTIGRNSFFVNLTEEQREELGGIEYRALKTLALILVGYFFFWHIFGVICLVPWILNSKTYGPAVTGQGQGRVWWGIFTAGSAFNDLGFTLTNNSMESFATAVFPMLLMTFLILFGNTGFPCMLRFVIWLLSKCVPEGSGLWEELRFLLDHPRRCFTLLFPRAATWWLFAVLVILNGVDLIFFIVLDLNDPVVTKLAPFIRFIDGLFQASSTRTAGFSVVDLADLHPAIQVSYLIMMYISVFPIAISMRRTNVYEEKSLGIYAGREEEEEDEKDPSYVGAHLRKQLGFDLWYIFLGLFIIAIVEGRRLADPNLISFNLFAVLFEIVSAYGTVGLSLGYPTINASFSAEFHTLSKLIIIAMQIRGRHRGLPYELDRAILLPSESLHETEAMEGQRIMNRRRSSAAYSAVEGAVESDRFRPETGLTSGFNQGFNHVRDRDRPKAEKKGNLSFGDVGNNHDRHVRTGLGNAMYKMASAPETFQDATDALRNHEQDIREE